MKLVSACLIGICSTYRQSSNTHNIFEQLLRDGEAVPICPEQLGGLPTPRPPAEIVGGDGKDVLSGDARVVTSSGSDVTENYIRGAREALRIATLVKPDLIILKERSPSCGVSVIYDGTFTKNLRPGTGVTTALLRANGYRVVSDEEYLQQNGSPAPGCTEIHGVE
jgi:uncharacterized protein YbbK (DUF523 family)